MEHEVLPSAAPRYLPLKDGDRFEYAGARLSKKGVYRICSVDGDQWHGEFPISPLEGELPAKQAGGGKPRNYGCMTEVAHVQ